MPDVKLICNSFGVLITNVAELQLQQNSCNHNSATAAMKFCCNHGETVRAAKI